MHEYAIVANAYQRLGWPICSNAVYNQGQFYINF